MPSTATPLRSLICCAVAAFLLLLPVEAAAGDGGNVAPIYNGPVNSAYTSSLVVAGDSVRSRSPVQRILADTTDQRRDLLGEDDDQGYTGVDIRTRRLRIRSDDGRDLFRLRGRLFVDAAYLFFDPTDTVDDDRPERGDLARYQTIIRNARLGAEGVMYEDWVWRIEAELRDAEIRFRGSYIEYIGWDPLRVTVGNIKEPVGMEWMTTRRRNTFIERAAPLDAYKPSWNIGGRVEYRGASYHLMGGLFGGNDVIRDRQITDGFALAGRATVAPYLQGRNYLHLGVSGSHRQNAYRNRADFEQREYLDVRLRTRLGTRAVDGRFIGREDISGAENYGTWAVEGAVGLGPVSLQGEVLGVTLNRQQDLEQINLWGWYAQASWFLTGEARTYRPGRGNFGALIPTRNFRPGFGPGAIELTARYAFVDSIEESDNALIYDGGTMDHFTLGINWYLARELRIMANYIYLDARRATPMGPGLGGKQTTGSLLALRFQIEI